MNIENKVIAIKWTILTLCILLQLCACGGGSGSGNQGPPPAQDFSLSVSPTSESLTAGNTASVSVEATAINGFSSQIDVQVTGQQGGVSVLPQDFSITPGTPQSVSFTAAVNTPTSSVTVDFSGSSGSLAHTAQLKLAVTGSYSGPPVRTRYVRTDATTEYFGWLNQHWAIHDTNTSHFFVTDPFSNHVFVLDDATESEIASISVPGAYGIDEAPDGSAIYVGTIVGDVYVINPATLNVTTRYMSSQIGPNGFQAWVALALSDGRLALLGPPGGVPSVDLPTSYALWDPSNNSISTCSAVSCGGGSIPGFTTSVDRTKLFTGVDGITEIDVATGQITSTDLSASPYEIATTPDGNYVLVYGVNGDVFVYDTRTLAQVADFAVEGGSGLAVSADSSTLYTSGSSHGGFVYAYSLPSGKALGWVPDIVVVPQGSGSAVGPIEIPYLLAADGTGLFAGPLEEGVGFVDLASVQTGSGATQFGNGYLVPATGPMSGGTATQNADPNPVGPLQSVFFGSQPATNLSIGPEFTINATSPAGAAGYVDVYTFTTDGGMQLLPEGFSYGPTILEVTPNMATQEGGGTGYVYGYGFGPNANGIPSGLQMTVGGTASNITSYNYFGYPNTAPPFPMEVFTYTIPSGGAQSPVDVTVTTSSGSTTASGAMTYLPPTQEFPLTGSELAQGVYDPYLGLYFFTDTSQVQVFSRTQGRWLSPIAIPAPPGATQRLWGIALSPDGTKLALSDASAGAIYLLNPSSPTSVQTFMVQISNPDGNLNPAGLAVSNAGFVYFAMFGGQEGYFKLNTSTGAITTYETGSASDDGAYLRAVITSDNSTVFFNSNGQLVSLDTATDTFTDASVIPFCCEGNNELSLSSNQVQLSSSSYIYDTDLNAQSFYALNDREIQYISYVYGAKVSADGRLIFQPSTNGIDVLDGNLGNLLQRVSLPFALSKNYDALVDDGTDNVLVAITGSNGSGIAIVDLTSIQDPPARSYLRGTASRRRESVKLAKPKVFGPRFGLPASESHQSAPGVRTVPHVTRSFPFHQRGPKSERRTKAPLQSQ